MHSALDVTASRVEGEIKAREAALIEAVRARTAELIGENKAWHQVCFVTERVVPRLFGVICRFVCFIAGQEQRVARVSDRIGAGAVRRCSAAGRGGRCAECARARSAESKAHFGAALHARAREPAERGGGERCGARSGGEGRAGLQGAGCDHPLVRRSESPTRRFVCFVSCSLSLSESCLCLITVTIDSKIVTDYEHQTLRRFVSEGKAKVRELKLLYRGSRDGFAAADFHRLCDDKGATLTVVQTPQGWVFGGHASVSWSSNNMNVFAPGLFLFTLRNSRNLPPQTFALTKPQQYALHSDAEYGPAFGGGPFVQDLFLASHANTNSSSFSRLGLSYALPAGCPSDLLAGAEYFTVSEMEVFGRRCAFSYQSVMNRVLTDSRSIAAVVV